MTDFILAKHQGKTVGTVSLEYAGEAALLRSLCVHPSHRGQAIAERLLARIEAKAASRGVRELYLLTTTAPGFFVRHGYSSTTRDDAPAGIRSTAQFRALCPSTAVCLHKSLTSSSIQPSERHETA